MGLHQEDPLPELKIASFAAIPHKSKQFCSILDLSFHLQLQQWGILPSVNATTVKTAPKGAIDQLGHSFTRIIHAIAETKRMPASLWPSGTLRMAFGGWMQRMTPNGISHVSCPSVLANQYTSWCPLHYKWGGWSHLRFSARALKRHGMWHRNVARQSWAPSHPTNSQNK
jgi:hypothetical protein